MLTLLLETIRDWVQTVLAKFHSMYLGYVTPQMYGAYGDGIHDDTQAVRSALNHGGKVYFPEGTYLIQTGNTINLTNKGLHIFGTGKNSSKIKYRYLTTSDATDIFKLVGNGSSDLTIEDIGIVYDNNDNNEAVPNGNASVLYLLGNHRDILINNILLHIGGTATQLHDGTQLIWSKCSAQNLVISNCVFEQFSNRQRGGCIWINSSSDLDNTLHDVENLAIHDNLILNTNKDEAVGIWTLGGDTTHNFHHISYCRNTIIHKDWNGTSYYSDNLLSLYGNSHGYMNVDAVLSDNKFITYNAHHQSVVKFAIIKGVQFTNNYICIATVHESTTIMQFVQTEDTEAVIKANVFEYKPNTLSINMVCDKARVDYIDNKFISDRDIQITTKAEEHPQAVNIIGNTFTFTDTSKKLKVYMYAGSSEHPTYYSRLLFKDNVCDTGLELSKVSDLALIDNTFNDALTSAYVCNPYPTGGKLTLLDNRNFVLRLEDSRITTKYDKIVYRGYADGLYFRVGTQHPQYTPSLDATFFGEANIVFYHEEHDVETPIDFTNWEVNA